MFMKHISRYWIFFLSKGFLRCFSWKHIHLWIFYCVYFWKALTKIYAKKCVYVCYICSEMGHDRLSYIFCKQTQKSEVLSHSVVSDSLRPHRLYPARLLCPWDSPGKNTGVGCHSLLQRIFQTQDLASQEVSVPSEPPGKPLNKHYMVLKKESIPLQRYWRLWNELGTKILSLFRFSAISWTF